MARPLKSGADYFPKDTDFYFDDKVRILRSEFGAKGMYMLDYLLCELYRTNGYFLNWDKSRCFLVSDGAGCGCSPEYISEFVQGCIRCSFFSKRVFDAFGVLTSAGIQRRYVRMFSSRSSIPIIQEYWLLNRNDTNDVPTSVLGKLTIKTVSGAENPGNFKENPGNIAENHTNKSKVKDTIVSQRKVIVPAELGDTWNAFREMREKIRKPMTAAAANLILKKLEELAPGDHRMQNDILNQSIMNSWQGVFPLKRKPAEDDAPPPSYDIEEMERRLLYGKIEYKKRE